MEYHRPDPEGEARGIRAVIFHNPDVAMAQLFYTIVAATTSDVLEHKWRASLKTIMILTSNTEATENKVQFLNLAYRVKGFQCHSNNSLQLLGRKTTTKQYT